MIFHGLHRYLLIVGPMRNKPEGAKFSKTVTRVLSCSPIRAPPAGLDRVTLQPRGRLGQDELKPLGSLWNGVVDDLHLYKLMPLAIHKMEHLCGQMDFLETSC
ncbi:hypothetical protein EYF80_039553 [Liparis tanakae]|uniref:Uncharacterized protein n=1 Tax=Liparis tanakae TaxID=230148 RepID=A0A4Z2G9S8_9TELE|nr:hypothetical protein EYF80_039553 [Liparis tanakae]